jgi:hypothetical protein
MIVEPRHPFQLCTEPQIFPRSEHCAFVIDGVECGEGREADVHRVDEEQAA